MRLTWGRLGVVGGSADGCVGVPAESVYTGSGGEVLPMTALVR